ncbi:unnamed protein product [Diamesa tonsa]
MDQESTKSNEEAFLQEMSTNASFNIIEGTSEGTIFELNQHEVTDNEREVDCLVEELLNKKYDKVDVLKYKNPCSTSFDEFRKGMYEISELIHKKVIKNGDGEHIDLESCKVTYEYSFYLENEDDPFDSSYINKKPACIALALGFDTFPGYTEAISTMTNKEESLFCISYMLLFGELGSPPRIPPKSDILCSIKILNVSLITEEEIMARNDPSRGKSFEKTQDKFSNLNKKAKTEFKNSNYYDAIESYKKAIELLEDSSLKNDEQQQIQQKRLISLRSNLCICYNKISNPQKTCIQMRELERLTSISNNPKMLYAKGRALTLLSDYRSARNYFYKALKMAPHSIEVQEAINILNAREKEENNFDENFAKSSLEFMAEAGSIMN